MFKRIKLTNFLSHKDTEINLFYPLLLFSGNNGSGKSSILDAITLCLFKRARTIDAKHSKIDNLIRFGEDEFRIELDLFFDEKLYEIILKKRRGKSIIHEIHCGNQIISGEECIKFISKLLNISYEMFISSCFLLQGKENQFFSKKSEDKKKIIEKILDLSIFSNCYKTVYEDRREIKIKKNQILETLEECKNSFLSYKEEYKKKYIPKIDKEIDLLSSKKEKIEEELNKNKMVLKKSEDKENLKKEFEQNFIELNEIKSKIHQLENNYNQNLNFIKSINEKDIEDNILLLEKKSNSLMKLKEKREKEKDELNNDIIKIKYQIKNDKEKLSFLKSNCEERICPLCKSNLSSKAVESIIDELNSIIEKNKQEGIILEKDFSLKEKEYYNYCKKDEILKNKILDLKKKIEEKKNYKSKNNDLKMQLKALKNIFTKQNEHGKKLKNELENIDEKQLEKIKYAINDLISQKSSLEEKRDNLLRCKGELSKIKECIKELKSKDSKYKDLLNKALKKEKIINYCLGVFSDKGILSWIIEKAINNLEYFCNEILMLLDDSLKIKFSFENIDRNLFNVSIINNGKILFYDLLSGGEKFRVDISLRIGLSKFLLDITKTGLQSLFIDEGMGSLDENGIERFSQILYNISRESIFKQIIIVTHRPELKGKFSNEIFFEQRNGISHVRR